MKYSLNILLSCLVFSTALAQTRPNVLFIVVDDLRPQTASYGKPFMHTPNIDRLANRGVLFERAYCMVPTCGASRAAVMTSLRPARNRFIDHRAWAERDAPDVTALNTQFKAHGYNTISLGKVYHHRDDEVDGWSELPWKSQKEGYQNRAAKEEAIAADRARYPGKRQHLGPTIERAIAPDDAYPDGDTARVAVERLRELNAQPDQPFFLAVGFNKPHLPFTAPQRYWDLYDHAKIDLPKNYHAPEDAPDGAVHDSGEMRVYAGVPPEGPVDEAMARDLIHGYYACVSFADAQVGRLLDELDRLGMTENTIVVLWGDHGWQLGEHSMWVKHSCFETSMHAPLLVAAPTTTGVRPGTRVSSLVEFIDIYPALCELTDLPIPAHVQGESFVPLMRDPTLPGKPYAVGRFLAGDTIRSDQARYSVYTTPTGEVTGSMLYDHGTDPNENVNIVNRENSNAAMLAERLEALKGVPNP